MKDDHLQATLDLLADRRFAELRRRAEERPLPWGRV